MSQHPAARDLLREIERHIRSVGMDPTTFGRIVMNDGNFIPRLKKGRNPTLATIDKVRRHIARQAEALRHG